MSGPRAFEIRSLNGLRAIAVLAVFVGHGSTAPERWPGHAGVTLFFFLSGYLITTLLRREYARNGRISLPKFYLRRALRILPPAYITIALAIVIGAFGLLPSTTTIGGVLAEVANVTNYYMIFFDRGGLPPETSMLWSLAVEEHFYLIFPAVMILLLRRGLTVRRVGVIMLVAASLGWVYRSVWFFGLDGTFLHLYTGTDARFDSLLFGAAMALLFNPALGEKLPLRIPEKALPILAAVGAIGFVLSSLVTRDSFQLTVADTIQLVCLMPVFWFVITRPDSIVGRILNNRAVAHIGVLSFSIYLLHRLVLALLQNIATVPVLTDVIALLITVAAAQLMWWTVERPLGNVRHRIENRLA